jgi:hypothetical protein
MATEQQELTAWPWFWEDLESFTTSVSVNQSKRCNIREDLNIQELEAPFTATESLACGGVSLFLQGESWDQQFQFLVDASYPKTKF